MFLPFDSQKAIQMVGVILRNHRASIASKLRILKILYVADRESIRDTGYPMLGSRVVAMDHGPLHSAALDLINGEHIDEPQFSQHFEKFGYMLQMSKDPGVGRLSRNDIEIIESVCQRYASVGDWDLAHDITHSFDEWKACHSAGTSTTIPLEAIIDAVGRAADRNQIIEDIRLEKMAESAFGERSL